MTLTEAAAILGVTPHTLRQQVNRKKLSARRMGRNWYVTPQAVAQYREQHLRDKTRRPI